MERISVLGDSWILLGRVNGVNDVIGDDEFEIIIGETDTIGLTEETTDDKDLIGLFKLFTIIPWLSIFIFFRLIDFANLCFLFSSLRINSDFIPTLR